LLQILSHTHIAFMLQKYCYTTDASVSNFKNELSNELLFL